MARTITLRWDATCRDCGAHLPAGSPARYYGRGKIYGVECHDCNGNRHLPTAQELAESDGLIEDQDHGGACEDFPCCGHHDGDGRNPFCAQARKAERDYQRRKQAQHPTPKDLAVEAGLIPADVACVETALDDAGENDLVALARGLA